MVEGCFIEEADGLNFDILSFLEGIMDIDRSRLNTSKHWSTR